MMASTTAANIQRVVKYIHQFIDAPCKADPSITHLGAAVEKLR